MLDLKATIEQIKRDHAGDLDVLVSPSDVDFDSRGRLIYQGTAFKFTTHSYRQWCNKIGVPHKFLASCPLGDGSATQTAIFNHFRASHNVEVLFRLHRGERNLVRAVLPGNYNVLDNDELLTRLASFVKEANMKVESVVIKDGNLDLKLLFPKTIAVGTIPGTKEPDIHHFGYFMRNSEVGTIGDVRGSFLVYRSACTNGMVFSNPLLGERRKQPLLSTSHLRGNADLVTDLETSFARFERMAPHARDALERSQARTLTISDAERELNHLLDLTGLNDSFASDVAKQFRHEPTYTRFGIAQALTAAARTLQTRARAKVESLAGDYILSK